MDSPIKKILEASKLEEEYITRFVAFGGQVEVIKMRIMSWNYLESLEFHNYNTEQLLIDCVESYEGNDLGNHLEWWIHWIATGKYEEKGIPLKHNSECEHRSLN
ncbi:MAG: hypothetical protein OEY94_10255 [Alphaproteobacteria bacterium]|nr:hypothetical protein [Alphaproteobacteria bacterium]